MSCLPSRTTKVSLPSRLFSLRALEPVAVWLRVGHDALPLRREGVCKGKVGGVPVELRGDRLLVGFHEWAWSHRTSGFPVWAITQTGELVRVGYTRKRLTFYRLPEGTVAVIRYYESNSGYRTLYVYSVPELEKYVIDEKEDFDMSVLPEGLRPLVEKAVFELLGED